jgi:putative ABC transport system substrate-binding protein
MRRREFIAGLGTAAWPSAARAQQPSKLWRIGFLSGAARPISIETSQWGGFLQGMRELGHVEGRDFVVEWRFAEGRSELFPGLAAELVSAKVDIVVAATGASVPALRQASSTLPIVMGMSTDPVGSGFVASLARPGGNITGLATSLDDTAPKQLQLLTMAVPNLSRVGFLSDPRGANSAPILNSVNVVAPAAGLRVLPVDVRTPREVESAFDTLVREGAQAVMVVGEGLISAQRRRVAELAIGNRLPTIFTRATCKIAVAR